MAVIALTTGVTSASTAINVTRTTLTASDTLTFQRGASQILSLFNSTASPVVVTLTGTAPATLTPDGYGGSLATTGGKAITVPASGLTIINLDDIWAFLSGTGSVTVTGGTGVIASLHI